jgi:hypothetical protein
VLFNLKMLVIHLCFISYYLGAEYEAALPVPNKHLDSPSRAKIGKSLRDIEKLLASQGTDIFHKCRYGTGSWFTGSISLDC